MNIKQYLELLNERLSHAQTKAEEFVGKNPYDFGFWWGKKSELESVLNDLELEIENALNSQFRALAN